MSILTLFAKLTPRRIIRWLLTFLVSLITLYVLIVAWTNFTGARSWAAAQAMLQREGETLDFQKIIPAPPPEDENFLATGPFLDIARPVKDGVEEERREDLANTGFDLKEGRLPSFGDGPAAALPLDITEWAAFFAKHSWITADQTPVVTAANLLAALHEVKPLLTALSDLAPSYDHATFTPHLAERMPDGTLFQLELSHYHSTQAISKPLALRSILAARSGNAADSLKSTLALAHLTQAMSEEPFLIGLLVSVTMQRQLSQATWEALNTSALAEEELRTLQSALARLDNEKASLLAMRGELASAIGTLRFAENNRGEAIGLYASHYQDATGNSQSSLAFHAVGWLLNRGFFDHNKATLVELEFGDIIRPLRDGGLPAIISGAPALEQRCRELSSISKPGSLYVAMAVPAFFGVFRAVIQAEAIHRQSLIACALERHFIRAGSYPEKLDALVPTLLPSVPLDPCDHKPMRYARTEQGRYRLWSVGLDGRDDQGAVNGKNSTDLKHPDYKGDWCWRYAP
jgi:hypothetical protein